MFGKEKEKSKEDIEKSVLEKVALQSVIEQRRKRRWGIFFKFAFLAYFIILLLLALKPFSNVDDKIAPHIALVKVDGIIADDSNANAKLINKSLNKAFKDKDAKAVVIEINSPGGSPVQSDDIYQQIRYLQEQNPKTKVYAVCEDLCASGGYYIASAAETIYANKMSIVGSIGVRAGGFGFVEAMKKIGVTRRLYTAGKDKGFLDPFEPQNETHVKDLEVMLTQTHEVFIDAVKEGRGNKIDLAQSDRIFSGLPFSGIEAKQLGLIDDFQSMDQLKRSLDAEAVVDYTQKEDIFERIATKMGLGVMYEAYNAMQLKLQ
jgi:protease-4